VLQLRVYGAGHAMAEVAETLSGLAGARHPTWTDAGDGSGRGLVTVELHPDTADRALEALRRHEVPAADITLLRLESIRPGAGDRARANLLWADLLGRAGQYARPVARYLVFMGVAAVIAAYGVI
jgi:hypothetical protein